MAINALSQSDREGHNDNILRVSSTFESAVVTGIVEAIAPFESEGEMNVSGSIDEFEVFDLTSEPPTIIANPPPVEFEVDILPGVRELTFEDIVDGLQLAMKIVVGDGESDTLESCTGGLLGYDVLSNPFPGRSAAYGFLDLHPSTQ